MAGGVAAAAAFRRAAGAGAPDRTEAAASATKPKRRIPGLMITPLSPADSKGTDRVGYARPGGEGVVDRRWHSGSSAAARLPQLRKGLLRLAARRGSRSEDQ